MHSAGFHGLWLTTAKDTSIRKEHAIANRYVFDVEETICVLSPGALSRSAYRPPRHSTQVNLTPYAKVSVLRIISFRQVRLHSSAAETRQR